MISSKASSHSATSALCSDSTASAGNAGYAFMTTMIEPESSFRRDLGHVQLRRHEGKHCELDVAGRPREPTCRTLIGSRRARQQSRRSTLPGNIASGKLPQLGHGVDHSLRDIIDFRLRVEAPYAKADRAVGDFASQTEGGQYV